MHSTFAVALLIMSASAAADQGSNGGPGGGPPDVFGATPCTSVEGVSCHGDPIRVPFPGGKPPLLVAKRHVHAHQSRWPFVICGFVVLIAAWRARPAVLPSDIQ